MKNKYSLALGLMFALLSFVLGHSSLPHLQAEIPIPPTQEPNHSDTHSINTLAVMSQTPFMYPPYRNINPSINSYIDHDGPNYTTNNTMSGTYFDGVRYVSGISASGASPCGTNFGLHAYQVRDKCMYYDGHSGYDYGMVDGTLIYPVATGIYYHQTESRTGNIYGEVVHDGVGAGYVTWYVHITEHLVPDGYHITDINTPIAKSGSGHLHLTVRKGGKFTDPYGWWGSGPDPLASISQGAESSWLWVNEIPPQDQIELSTGHFADVDINNSFFGYIEALYGIGAISGFSDGTFHPDDIATRGATAKVIVLSLGLFPEYTDSPTVCSIPSTHTFYPYIRLLLESGISTCPSDGNWKPDDPMTRAGLAKFIILGRGDSPSYPVCEAPFTDVSCSYTFYSYIRRLKEIFAQKNVQLGYSDGSFHPDEGITRSGLAKLVVVGLDLENAIPSFYDVLSDNIFYKYVEGIAERGITNGCGSTPPLFCPDDPLTRGGIAKFIVLAMGENPTYNDGVLPFPDVPVGHTFYRYIRRLQELNITTGYSDGTYRPDVTITRGAIAKFIVRALAVQGVTCQYNAPQAFSDVPPGHTFYNDIQCLKELKISSGFSDGTFRPDDDLTRAAAAKFIHLAFIERAATVPQESSDQTNNDCNSGIEGYIPWQRYIVTTGDSDCFQLPVVAETNNRFLAQSNNAYEIATHYTGLSADIKIEVLGSDGNTVLASSGGQNGDKQLLWTPLANGSYYVRLTNTNPYATYTDPDTTYGAYTYVTAEWRLPPDSDLVGYWPFEEGSGSTALDMTSNQNNGTIYNANYVEGKVGQALHFDGVDDYVEIADSNSLDLTNQMTIATWVKPDSICNSNNPLVQKDASYGLKITNLGQAIGFIWSGWEPHQSTTTLYPGTWYHLVSTFDNGLHQIYVNGELENQSMDAMTTIPVTTYPLTFAKGAFSCNFAGTLDEVRIYNRVYSDRQINNLYHQDLIGVAKAYLPIALYHFFSSTLPNAPSQLQVSSTSQTSVSLVWQDNSLNETGFKIYRYNGSTFQYLSSVGVNTVAFTDSGLSCNTSYAYRITAYNDLGESAQTTQVNGQTTSCTQPQLPSAPSNALATALTTTQIQLTWSDNSNNETGFKIYRFDGSDFQYFNSVGANTTTFIDSGLSCGTTYYYKISAYNSTGESAQTPQVNTSTAVCPQPPSAPSNAIATPLTTSQMQLTWSDNSSNETSFEIGTDTGVIGTVGANITQYTVSGLSASTWYCYHIRSSNGAGQSTWTDWACNTTLSNGDSYEPDNTSGQANWLYSNSPQSHSIVPATDIDWVKFTLSENSQVTLETSGASGDTRMWLYDSSLNQIDYDDDGGTGTFSRIDRLCGVNYLSAGTYYVKIDEYQNDSEIAAYSINLNVARCGFSYFDDFSNSSSGWPIDNVTDYTIGYQSGEYEVTLKAPNYGLGIVYPYVGTIDYTVEADMRLYNNDPVRYGLIFNWLDWNNYYQFSVNPTSQAYTLEQRTPSGWITINTGTSSCINTWYATNHLIASKLGSLIEIRVNGCGLGIFTGNISGSLRTGLYIKSGTNLPVTARFDNYLIQEIISLETTNSTHSPEIFVPLDAIVGEEHE